MTRATWIRLNADEVDAQLIGALAEALQTPDYAALGLYAALAGAVARLAPTGNIAAVPDRLVEQWAHWRGKKGRFAKAVRDILQTDDGELVNWRESVGRLVDEREKERDRWHRRQGARPPGDSAESSRSQRGDSAPTNERDETNETNGEREERTALARAHDPRDMKAANRLIRIATKYSLWHRDLALGLRDGYAERVSEAARKERDLALVEQVDAVELWRLADFDTTKLPFEIAERLHDARERAARPALTDSPVAAVPTPPPPADEQIESNQRRDAVLNALTAAHKHWQARIGETKYFVFIGLLEGVLSATPAPYTASELCDAIEVLAEERANADPRFRERDFTPKRLAANLHDYVRLGRMELVDEYGGFTERGVRAGLSQAIA